MSGSLLDIDTSDRELNPQTLSFQDFGSSGGGGKSAGPTDSGGMGGGAIGSSMLKPQALESMHDVEAQQPGPGGFWTLRYYQPLFDVDTVQVLNRIKSSLLPRPRGAFFDLISANPDLWGPFWIATTLIFAMAITGNLASYYAYKGPSGGWTYNFNQLTLAGSVVYSYVTLLPLLLWLALRYYEAHKRLVDIICIYGYTLGVFVPVSVLCVLPSEFMRWVLVFLGGGISGLFLLSNLHAHLSDCFPYGEGDAKRKTAAILGGIAVCHVVLLFLFKISFFHYSGAPAG